MFELKGKYKAVSADDFFDDIPRTTGYGIDDVKAKQKEEPKKEPKKDHSILMPISKAIIRNLA